MKNGLSSQQDRSVRIIGGKWRGRKVTFPTSTTIRPTPDRVRETLFNWLMADIAGASCLDLYAGSGAIGLEALSRGASEVCFIDSDPRVINNLQQNLNILEADPDRYQLVTSPVDSWLSVTRDPFDLIFIDAPFSAETWINDCQRIASEKLARRAVYLETGRAVTAGELPADWTLHRQKKAGAVHFCLCFCG
ncbi:MAG: 16S rRNA (guanine(966)-N(2))-methyltransferase RsmD [Proteobacteria bacterium]|nr:16S rRNA (guanine(966)-N(2))-methyltransferase RsmD [Pseudomonadota bacterium]